MTNSFILNLELGNAAMQTNQDMADMLRSLADQFARYGNDPMVEEGAILRDYNGNTVGSWAIAIAKEGENS